MHFTRYELGMKNQVPLLLGVPIPNPLLPIHSSVEVIASTKLSLEWSFWCLKIKPRKCAGVYQQLIQDWGNPGFPPLLGKIPPAPISFSTQRHQSGNIITIFQNPVYAAVHLAYDWRIRAYRSQRYPDLILFMRDLCSVGQYTIIFVEILDI